MAAVALVHQSIGRLDIIWLAVCFNESTEAWPQSFSRLVTPRSQGGLDGKYSDQTCARPILESLIIGRLCILLKTPSEIHANFLNYQTFGYIVGVALEVLAHTVHCPQASESCASS